MKRTAFKSWLFYVPGDVFFILFNIYILSMLKNDELIKENELLGKYKKIMKYTLLMSCLVFIEDSFVIFKIDVYSDTILNITNRNFSEDILRISQSVIIISYFFNFFMFDSRGKEDIRVISPRNNYRSRMKDKSNNNSVEIFII